MCEDGGISNYQKVLLIYTLLSLKSQRLFSMFLLLWVPAQKCFHDGEEGEKKKKMCK